MGGIGEVYDAVSRASEELPFAALRDALTRLDEDHGRLQEALSGSTNPDAEQALRSLAAAAASIKAAIDEFEAAHEHCETFLAYV